MCSSDLNYTRITSDANTINLKDYDLIINTSAEHMSDDWFKQLTTTQLIAIQSNNLNIEDHINVCHSLVDFKDKYPMNFEYLDQMEFPSYIRYMAIGNKSI